MSRKPYFGKEVDAAIKEYISCEEKTKRDRIFAKTIYPALNKLVENVIHNRKFYNFGSNSYLDAKHECVVHLLERLEKFDPDKGSRAFSYFNRITINWIWANMSIIGQNTQGRCDVEEIDKFRNLEIEYYGQEYQNELNEFCDKFAKWGLTNIDYFYFYKNGKVIPFAQKDKQILDAIFNLFEDASNIDIFNKKYLYILVREQVDVKTQSITDVVNVLRPICKEMFLDFRINGTKYWHRFLYYPEEIEDDDIYIARMFE